MPSNSDSASWAGLLREPNPAVFHSAWVVQLARGLSDLEEIVLVLGPANIGPFEPVSTWPHRTPCSHLLQGLAEQVLEMRRPVRHANEAGIRLAYPILRGDELLGVVGIGLAAEGDEARARQRLTQAQGWLLAHSSLHTVAGDSVLSERLLVLLELLLSTHSEQGALASIQAVLSEAAVKLGCDRISYGSAQGAAIKLRALSQAADFSRRIDLVRDIEAAMNEAVDQRLPLQYPVDKNSPATDQGTARAQAHLARQQGNAIVLTRPFALNAQLTGALVFEWAEVPNDEVLGLAEGIAAVVGRVLLEREQADLSLWGAFKRSSTRQLRRLFGPRFLGRKLLLLALLGIVVFFATATGTLRLSADAHLEGSVNRSLSAPFDGYVDQAFYRAGQVVEQGAVLARLDERDLQLERLASVGRLAQFEREMRVAQANRDAAAAQIAQAQMDEAEAQLALTEMLLQRTQMRAPFDAVITSGDLSQDLGRPVQRGDVLFELAPVADYRVVALVDERDIALVEVGQPGRLVLRAHPEEPLAIEVTLVTPVSTPGEGSNRFRVEARLLENPLELRPGMAGLARIEAGEGLLISNWTREARHWLSLMLWRWLG